MLRGAVECFDVLIECKHLKKKKELPKKLTGSQMVDVTQSSKRIKFSEENWELGQDAQNCFAHLQLDPQIS